MAAYGRKSDFDFNRKTNPFDSDDEFEKVNGDDIRRQMQMSRDRTLDSTKRSLALIEESHDIAVRTGEELQCQGEQLNRIERNLDDIQNTMGIAKRHIRSVNSIWGAFGNYFKKAPKAKETTEQSTPDSRLSGMRQDSSLYYGTRDSERESGGYDAGIRRSGQFEKSAYSSRDPREREIEANLDLVSRGLGRLKEDALILGSEIERHNEQLDRLGVKADRAYNTVEASDKKVRRILGK